MKKKPSASSQRELLRRVKSDTISLSKKAIKEIDALKKRKIELTEDAPKITHWDKATVGKFYRPIKKQITIRVDADVLEWFKHAAKKYQSLMNEACREYMEHHSGNKRGR